MCDAIGLDQVHLVAVSIGGMIATELAVRFPTRVVSIVLLGRAGGDGYTE